MGTCGSGARTGMEVILLVLLQTLKGLQRARTGLAAVAAGATTPGSAGQRIATAIRQTAGSTASVSALPGRS